MHDQTVRHLCEVLDVEGDHLRPAQATRPGQGDEGGVPGPRHGGGVDAVEDAPQAVGHEGGRLSGCLGLRVGPQGVGVGVAQTCEGLADDRRMGGLEVVGARVGGVGGVHLGNGGDAAGQGRGLEGSDRWRWVGVVAVVAQVVGDSLRRTGRPQDTQGPQTGHLIARRPTACTFLVGLEDQGLRDRLRQASTDRPGVQLRQVGPVRAAGVGCQVGVDEVTGGGVQGDAIGHR